MIGLGLAKAIPGPTTTPTLGPTPLEAGGLLSPRSTVSSPKSVHGRPTSRIAPESAVGLRAGAVQGSGSGMELLHSFNLFGCFKLSWRIPGWSCAVWFRLVWFGLVGWSVGWFWFLVG